ncbi:hypothetical protein F4777DRAFT_317866 [Nemania sp. FL0916]|nr:hypothetical protein F4777DRAFT_317866 [Nemania sp. FL0916]
MDVSTASDSNSDSDSNDITPVQFHNDIHSKRVPAFVVWREAHGETRSLPSSLHLSLLYKSAQKALICFQTTTKLRKGPAKPNIYLFIKPDQISTLTYIGNEDTLERDEEELHKHARERLGTSTHVLRFELRSPASFVVPGEYPFKFYRAGSQAIWRSWKAFAKDTHCFFAHFPMTTLSKAQLLSFCNAASTPDTLTSLNDNITSLYGGKGGRVVDPLINDEDSTAQAESGIGLASDENTAPPAYQERALAGPSLSSIAPPLCLSPDPDSQRFRKRRREDSAEPEDTKPREGRLKSDEGILQAILGLQQTVLEARAAHEASLSKIMVKVEGIEERFKQLEEEQRNLVDEVRTHMAPLWDEMDSRLQSQEDREQVHVRDVIEEIVDENIKEKMVEAVEEYFTNDGDGRELIHKVIHERVQEEAKDFFQSHSFTGHFTIK